MVSFTGETDTTPAFRGEGSESVRMNDDATFEGDRKMTLRFDNWCSTVMKDLSYDPRYDGDNVWGVKLSTAEHGSNFSFKEHYYLERFHEAYPDTLFSGWFGTELTQKQLNFVLSKCDPDCSSGRITVVSYEQSDTYAMQ